MKKSTSILIVLLVLLSLVSTVSVLGREQGPLADTVPVQVREAASPLIQEAPPEKAKDAIPLAAKGRIAPLSGGDTCSAATDLASIGFACDGSTYVDVSVGMGSATPSGGPAGSCWLDGPSVDNDRWYVWTNTTGAAVSLNVSTDDPVNSGGDSQIAIYDSCTTPTELACSEDTIGNFLSDVTLSVADGETVYIQLDGFAGDAFFDQAFFTCSVVTTPPANDERANATAVSTLPFTDTLDTSGATTAVTDPSTSCGDIGQPEQSASVWYTYTPPESGFMEVSTCGSDYDTVIEIWDGSGANLAPLSPPACNDEALICGPQSRLTNVALEAGTTYYIEVMGAGNQGGGNLDLSINFNLAPIADAGPDQTVAPNTLVELDGSGSYDPNGDLPLTYRWTQSGGPSVELSDPAVVTPTFTAPSIQTVLTFTLVVSDSTGLADPTPDEVVITVVNLPPIANAGPNQTVPTLAPVTLDGSGSSDPDGNLPLTYGWTQTGGPAVSLSDPAAITPTFTAPSDPAVLIFGLVVTDSLGLADPTPDEVVITVTNQAPIADAGPDQTVDTLALVMLDGSGSSDPDGDLPLTYGWTQTGGLAVTLSDPAAITPTFTAPADPAVLTFSLVVTDSLGLPDPTPDEVVVTVANQAPIADAGPDQTVDTLALVMLDGSGSSDPDGDLPLTYGWTQTGGPAVILSDPTAITPTFTAPADPAVLTFSLTVTDSLGLPDPTPDEVVITIANQPPVADAGVDQTVPTLALVTLDGSGSSDPDGNLPLAYLWMQTGGPAVTLSDPTAITPTFTAPADPAVLAFSLVVTDSLGLADPTPDDVVITVTNQAPIADAGADQIVSANASVTLDGSGSSDPDGDLPLTYGWTQTGGPAVTLSDPAAITPTFTAPFDSVVLTFSLIVTDSLGLADPTADEVMVVVEKYRIFLPIILR